MQLNSRYLLVSLMLLTSALKADFLPVAKSVLFDFSSAVPALQAAVAATQQQIADRNTMIQNLNSNTSANFDFAKKLYQAVLDGLQLKLADYNNALAAITAIGQLSPDEQNTLYQFYVVLQQTPAPVCVSCSYKLLMFSHFQAMVADADIAAVLADQKSSAMEKAKTAEKILKKYASLIAGGASKIVLLQNLK